MHHSARLALSLLTCAFAFHSLPAAAQDGALRQRLKERWQQRQQQKADQQTATRKGGDAEAGPQGRISQPGDYRYTIQHDGLERMYRIHVPTGYDPAQPAPMLVALHGGVGNMDFEADDSKYGLITKSDREGFVAVFPNGYSKLKSGKLATWNAGNCCGGARDNDVDDVGFIRQVVGEVAGRLNIDRKRIYATGMSNGGMMAYRLACDAPDLFAAIAPVAGTDNTRHCTPSRAVSVLHIHAKDDNHVQFNGGAGSGSLNKAAVTDYVSVPDTIAKWVKLDGCSAAPRRVLDKDGAYCEVYSACKGQSEVQLCVTETGGHSWPGSSKMVGTPASQAISANDVMWDFFSRH